MTDRGREMRSWRQWFCERATERANPKQCGFDVTPDGEFPLNSSEGREAMRRYWGLVTKR